MAAEDYIDFMSAIDYDDNFPEQEVKMAKFNGIVSRVLSKTFDDGGVANSFQIEGSPLYFRCGKKRHAGVVEKGNTIEFYAEQTADNAAKVSSDPTVAKKAATQETAAAATGGAVAYAPQGDRNASIVYQSSRKDALQFVQILLSQNLVSTPAAAAKKVAFVEALVDKYTAQFVSDVDSQGAIKRAVVEAPKPEKAKVVESEEDEGDEE